jgi:hypothetical protein
MPSSMTAAAEEYPVEMAKATESFRLPAMGAR